MEREPVSGSYIKIALDNKVNVVSYDKLHKNY